MEHSWLAWAAFITIVVVLLAFDLGVLHRKEREIKVKEALWLSLFYFACGMAFGLGVFYFDGQQAGYEYLTGYLIEKTLSVDNLFVFVLIFTYFQVPAKYQHRVLFWGILGALVMRGVLIFAGAHLIERFHWIIYIFGAFLVFTGIKMLLAADSEPDMENNKIVSFVRKRFRVTENYEGQRFFVRRDGKLWFTPLFLVLILVEFSDLIFAVDSIPAIFAITHDPFIIFTSNVFAILGLRALYFALAAIVHRFEYLKYGLSVVLVLIGGKMLINAWYEAKVVPTEVALLATVVILAGSMLFSMHKTRGKTKKAAYTGWVPGSDPVEKNPKQ